MNLERVKKILRNYLSGKDSEQGRRLIDRWYHSFDDRNSALDELPESKKKQLGEKIFSRIESSINASGKKKRPAYKRVGSFTARNPFFRVAAVFLLVGMLAFLVFYVTGPFSEGPPENIAYAVAENPRGQTSQITLSDGTRIWLGAESRLRYPEQFSDSLREVYLTGQAFFEVARNEDKPFAVYTSELMTRVLGTSFNIRAYSGDENIEVTVATGRVSVEKNAADVDTAHHRRLPLALLTPDKQIVYDRSTGKTHINTVNAGVVSGWKEGQLTFNKENFAQIAEAFERWYGVQFNFENEQLKHQYFTFSFTGMPLTYALNMMQNTSNFSYTIRQDTVWVKD